LPTVTRNQVDDYLSQSRQPLTRGWAVAGEVYFLMVVHLIIFMSLISFQNLIQHLVKHLRCHSKHPQQLLGHVIPVKFLDISPSSPTTVKRLSEQASIPSPDSSERQGPHPALRPAPPSGRPGVT